MTSRTAFLFQLHRRLMWQFRFSLSLKSPSLISYEGARILVNRPPASSFTHNRNMSSGDGRDGSDNHERKSDASPSMKTDNEIESNGEEDVFGVNYDDKEDRLGPSNNYPPNYKRDDATGRMTGEVKKEISTEDKELLDNISNSQKRDHILQRKINSHWDELCDQGEDGDGDGDEETIKKGRARNHQWASEMGRRVRQADMGLNVLGRSVKAQGTSEITQDEEEPILKDPARFSQRLTKDEFESFQSYMKKQHKVDILREDIPVMEHEQAPVAPLQEATGEWRKRIENQQLNKPDDSELSTKWMTTLAQRQMENSAVEDNPYADLMPSDMSISRLVNRKNARRIPVELLHHNNIPLLQSFLTPTSQIQHRMHTRLGARDQRKIAKLIKRARAMGLIPFQGQFSSEQHGWIHAPDIHETRDWEKELVERGLTIQRPPMNQHSERPEKRVIGSTSAKDMAEGSDTWSKEDELQ